MVLTLIKTVSRHVTGGLIHTMVEYMSAGKDGVLMIILIMPMIMKHIKHHNICYPIWVVIMVRVIKTDFCHGSGDNE